MSDFIPKPPPRGVRSYNDGAVPGRLFDSEPFGAHYNAEMALIGSMLRSYGQPGDSITRNQVRNASFSRYESWSEWQQRVFFPRMRHLAAKAPSDAFTAVELAYLQDRLTGVNDPVGQSSLEKVVRLIMKNPPAH